MLQILNSRTRSSTVVGFVSGVHNGANARKKAGIAEGRGGRWGSVFPTVCFGLRRVVQANSVNLHPFLVPDARYRCEQVFCCMLAIQI